MGRKLFLIPIVAYHRANLRLQKVPDHAQTDPLVGRKRILHRQEISVWTRGGHHLLHRWGHGVCNRGHEGSSQVPATGADAQQPGMNTIVCTIVSIGVLPWLCRSPFHVVRRLDINGLPSPGPAGWNIAKRARMPRGRRRESGRAASWVWVLVTPPVARPQLLFVGPVPRWGRGDQPRSALAGKVHGARCFPPARRPNDAAHPGVGVSFSVVGAQRRTCSL